MGKYTGKSIVITGGSSGVGLETAKLFANEGARVLITGRSQATLDAAKSELGPDAIAVQSDSTSLSDMDALADRVKTDFGSIDALFVNAGINGFAPFESTPEEMYDEVFAINTKGPYFTVQKLAPLIVEGGGVVLTTSVANVQAIPTLSAYSASKGALRAMTRGLARELLTQGVRVNAVSPGAINTGILAKSMPQEAVDQIKEQMAGANPMLRIGEPAEVARAVAFLAFDATYTTGSELAVDGGDSQL